MQVRKILLTTHLCAGLIAAVFLIILGVTGSVMVFEEQIDHRLNSNLSYVQPGPHRLSLTELKTKLETANPGYHVNAIGISNQDDLSWSVSLTSRELKNSKALAVNQYTGAVLGELGTGNDLVNYIHQFHIRLLA